MSFFEQEFLVQRLNNKMILKICALTFVLRESFNSVEMG